MVNKYRTELDCALRHNDWSHFGSNVLIRR